MSTDPTVSVVLATHNRADVVLATITRVLSSSGPGRDLEIIAVDNASTDGTADAVERRFPTVRVIRLTSNCGACAKELAVPLVRAPFILFLDDDSYPRPGSIDHMLEHFDRDPELAAAGFRVHLPDGSQESGALPDIFVGCGVGLRTTAVRGLGSLDTDLFMAAEEYHLAFRLVNAGWKIRLFDDLHVDHLKTPHARRNARLSRLDTRNNLLLAMRYLPAPYDAIYAQDWRQRYGWLAEQAGHELAFARGNAAGSVRGWVDRRCGGYSRLSPTATEALFQLGFVERQMQILRGEGLRRIVLADLGKNVYAYHRGARAAGLTVLAVADDRFARSGREYRNTPVIPVNRALGLAPDAFVVANMSPVHAAQTRRRLAALTPLPIHDWFGDPAPVATPGNPPLRPALL